MATKEQATEQKMKLLIAGQQWKGNSKGKMSDYYEKGKGKGKEKGKKGKSKVGERGRHAHGVMTPSANTDVEEEAQFLPFGPPTDP